MDSEAEEESGMDELGITNIRNVRQSALDLMSKGKKNRVRKSKKIKREAEVAEESFSSVGGFFKMK